MFPKHFTDFEWHTRRPEQLDWSDPQADDVRWSVYWQAVLAAIAVTFPGRFRSSIAMLGHGDWRRTAPTRLFRSWMGVHKSVESSHHPAENTNTTARHRKHRTGGMRVRNRFGALLQGMLHCVPCGCRMIPAQTTRNGSKRYRYYVCINAQKRGWHNCPSKSIPAAQIERFVVEQVKSVAADPRLIAETLTETRRQIKKTLAALDVERQGVQKDLEWANAEMGRLLDEVARDSNGRATARLANLQERARIAERRLTEIREEEYGLRAELVDEDDVTEALQDFASLWESFSPREQARVIELLIERVDYDGANSRYRPGRRDGAWIKIKPRPAAETGR